MTTLTANIKVRSFTGAGIKIHLPSIVSVREEVFRDYPFLYGGSTEDHTRYMKQILSNKEAIAVLVFDGPKVVGVSTGAPLEDETPEMQKPFLDRELDPSEYFSFTMSALLRPYRGRGLAHHLYDIREEHVRHLKRFKKICFATIYRTADHSLRPRDLEPLDNFWKKRGYVEHKELTTQVKWRDINEKNPTPKQMVYWIKNVFEN